MSEQVESRAHVVLTDVHVIESAERIGKSNPAGFRSRRRQNISCARAIPFYFVAFPQDWMPLEVRRVNFKTTTRTKWIAAAVALFWIGLRLSIVFLVDLKAVHAWAEGLNPVLLFAASAILPVFGFPTTILHVIVGARFGPAIGVLLTTVTVLINLLVIYWIGGALLAKPVTAFLSRGKFRLPVLPNRDQAWVALLTALLPGPYTVKNYLLSIGKVPLRKNLLAGWPVYVLRCSSVILFGGFAHNLTPGKIAFLVAYGAAVALLCRFVMKRLQVSLRPETIAVAA